MNNNMGTKDKLLAVALEYTGQERINKLQQLRIELWESKELIDKQIESLDKIIAHEKIQLNGNKENYLHKHELKSYTDYTNGRAQIGTTIIHCWDTCKLNDSK
jgi:hypothetical protein